MALDANSDSMARTEMAVQEPHLGHGDAPLSSINALALSFVKHVDVSFPILSTQLNPVSQRYYCAFYG